MSQRFNPYRPNGTAGPGMFCGRYEEMDAVEHCLLQTKFGNPQHFLIEGERGIGKSSLILFEHLVATGKVLNTKRERFDFVVVSIALTDADNQPTMIKKISQRLKGEVAKREKLKDLALKAWDFVSRIEAGGVKLNKQSSDVDDNDLLDLLVEDICAVSERNVADGILLLIDEADKGAAATKLGLFCKLLTEELTRRGVEKLCIGLAGQPGIVDLLRASHESSPRLFRCLYLKPLEVDERTEVIDRGISDANDKNEEKTIIDDSAKSFIAELSEGYPHFLQEFAYCAFDSDRDCKIDIDDVLDSLLGENGALDQLGKKYFNHVYNAPASDDYRKILRAMADSQDQWVERVAIITASGVKAQIVDNGLRALKQRNIIVQDDAVRGRYRLPTRSFATWIKVRATAEAKAEG